MFLDEEKKEGGNGMNLRVRHIYILAEMPASTAGMSPISFVFLSDVTTFLVYNSQ